MVTSIKIKDFCDIKKIGAGSFWSLYRAVHEPSDTWHLLQILHKTAARDARLVNLFRGLREAHGVLHHDNILTPLAFDDTSDAPFLMYDDFDGQMLLNPENGDGSVLSEEQAAATIRQVAEALQFAQIRGIRHGWVMPEMILRSPSDGSVKIIGFGSEKLWNYIYDKRADIAARVNPYIPPENLGLATQPTPDDCYALGVTFYHLLTGRLPFGEQKVAALKQQKLEPSIPWPDESQKKISPQITELVESLLDPKPYRRATYSSLLNELNPRDHTGVPLDRLPYEKESGLTRVRDFVAEINPLSKHVVGSTKKIAYTVMISVIALVLIFSIVVVLKLSSNDKKRVQQIYAEYLAEQEYQQMNDSSTSTGDESTPSPRVNDQREIGTERKIESESTVKNSLDSSPAVTEEIQNEPKQAITDEKSATEIKRTNMTLAVSAQSQNVTAEIFIDGQRRGYSDTNGSCLIADLLVNKTYRLRVVKDGYQPLEKSVFVKDGENKLDIQLMPEVEQNPSFTFAAVDFADKIKINDESMARNLPCTITAPIGKITVTYIDSKADFSWRTSFELIANQGPISVSAEQVGKGDIVVILNDPIQYGYAFVTIDDNNEQQTTPFRASLNTGWHRVRIFRDGYAIAPADTSIFIRPGVKLNLRCTVL